MSNMPVEITIKGNSQQALAEVLTRIKPKLRNGLVNAANWTLLESFPKVPVETGSLARSGRVRVAEGSDGFVVIYVGYGIQNLTFPIAGKITRKGSVLVKKPFEYAEIQHRRGHKSGWLTTTIAGGVTALDRGKGKGGFGGSGVFIVTASGTAARMFRQGLHLGSVEPMTTLGLTPVPPTADEITRHRTVNIESKTLGMVSGGTRRFVKTGRKVSNIDTSTKREERNDK